MYSVAVMRFVNYVSGHDEKHITRVKRKPINQAHLAFRRSALFYGLVQLKIFWKRGDYNGSKR